MGVVSTIDELDLRLKSELDPFEDMCGPKSQSTISSYKAQHGLKASRSPVKKVLMLRPPTSQTLSDLAALQNEKAHLSQQMKQMEAWVKNAESRHGSLIKANRHMRLMLEKADKELEMSRLKQDKLADMLSTAEATKQAAEQRSRRLEIKFARSDKGHALMQSAKLQASATELDKQIAQLQAALNHKEQVLANSQAKVVELHRSLMHHARLTGIKDEELLVSNSNLAEEVHTSKEECNKLTGQLQALQQQLSLSKDAEANAAKLQASNTALRQQAQELEERNTAAMQQSGQMQQQYQDELATLQSRLLAVADRDAEELNEARREFDERVAAMRAQLEQQEVDNAALLDVVQDLEDQQTPEALATAQTSLTAAHDQNQQLQQQLQQAQAAAVELSSTKTHLILLQSQLHQQKELCQQQTAGAEALTSGIDRERSSWQAEYQSLTARAQAAESEASRLQQSVHNLKFDNQKAAAEARKSSQQWAVTQADLRATRHQLKVLQQQTATLKPAPTTEVALQQAPPALQSRIDELLLELDSKTQEVRNVNLARGILVSELELASGVQIKGEARLKAELDELREDLETKSHVVTALQAELGAKCDELQDSRTELESLVRSAMDKETTESGLLAAQNASLRAELASKSQELQLAAEEYANLEALTRSASDEQAANEEQLLGQLTQLQHENRELKGVQGACKVLEQSVANLKQRLNAEEAAKAELTGKLQNAVNIPSELQHQLQHAQQQNQTLARILAKECAQAAAHVENQQQLQAVWHQLVTAQHLPVNATLQEQAALLGQLLHVQPQLDGSASQQEQQQQGQWRQQQQQQSSSSETSSSAYAAGLPVLPPSNSAEQEPNVQHSSAKSASSSAATVNAPISAVEAVHSSTETSAEMLATSDARLEGLSSALQGSVVVQPFTVSSAFTMPQCPGLIMASPSLDPNGSASQYESSVHFVPMKPALAHEAAHSQGYDYSPALNTSQLQPVIGSPSLDPSHNPALSPSLQKPSMQPFTGSPSLDPSQRLYVAQRVKELQSRAGSPLSPERSASSASMLAAMLSPRSGDRQARSASPHAILHPPIEFSSPSKDLHSHSHRSEPINTSTHPGATVSDSSAYRNSSRRSLLRHGTVVTPDAAGDTSSVMAGAGQLSTRQVHQSQQSADRGDSNHQAESDPMHDSSPRYEMPPEAVSLGGDAERSANMRRAGRLDTSSSAVELRYDDDSDSTVSSCQHSAHDSVGMTQAGPQSEASAQFGPEASILSLSGDSRNDEDSNVLENRQAPALLRDSKAQQHPTGNNRPLTLKQQLSDLHSSFKQMRARFTPPQSRQLSRQSSASGL